MLNVVHVFVTKHRNGACIEMQLKIVSAYLLYGEHLRWLHDPAVPRRTSQERPIPYRPVTQKVTDAQEPVQDSGGFVAKV